ncbi:MAG: nitroreductase family protein [Candidatus Accumulibacter sp.]|jgi:nitroreductase|nr:nitroreductase family protein [Accumulibacter sp.]
MKEIFERTSVRRFTGEAVPKDAVRKLLEAAMQAPSAGNQQPWEFIVVEDAEHRRALAGVSPYATPLVGAPLGIVVLLKGDALRFPECWRQDLSACTENLLLEAVHLGLGAVWLAIADFPSRIAAAKKLFNLPEHVSAFAAIAVGYPVEKKKATLRFDESRVHYETYP